MTGETESEQSDRSLGILGSLSLGSVTRIQVGALLVGVLSLLAAPLWGPRYLYLLSIGSIWAILAMGWDIISGHTGYISFGHSALSGAAAYTTAILVTQVNPEMSMAITIPASVVVAFVVGMLFALPSLRLSGPYFSLLTLLMVLLLSRLVNPFSEWTGGELGLAVPPLASDIVMGYYMTLIPMFIIAAVLLYVSQSNVGMVLIGIKNNERTVEDAGLDTTKFKIGAFGLSAVTMGIGGALLGHFYGYVDPSTVLTIDRSIEMIVMVAIGGMGTVLGPVAGAYTFVFVRDELLVQMLQLGSTQRWIVLWFTTAVVVFYFRDGLFVRFWRWLGQFETLRGLLGGTARWGVALPGRLFGGVKRAVGNQRVFAPVQWLAAKFTGGDRS